MSNGEVGITRIEREMIRRIVKYVKLLGLLILFFILFNLSVFNVPAGYAGVIFNRLEGGIKDITYSEGWHFKIPIIESSDIQEVRVRKTETTIDAASKDLQDVQTTIALNYHLDKSRAHLIYQNIGWEYESRIVFPAIEESVKAISAKYTAEELITRRPEVSSGIKQALTERLKRSDILVDEFSIVNFQFTAAFDQAIESKQVAEQEALREKRVLEKIKIQAEQRIAEAEGIKQSNILKAEGEAQARLLVAEAEAKAIDLQGKALKENPDVILLRQIEKWDGKVPVISGTSALPIIDAESFLEEKT